MTSTLVSVEIQYELRPLPLLRLSIESQISYLPDARKIKTTLKCTTNAKKEPFRTKKYSVFLGDFGTKSGS